MPILRWLTRDDDIGAADMVPYRLLEEAPDLGYGDRDNLNALKSLGLAMPGRLSL